MHPAPPTHIAAIFPSFAAGGAQMRYLRLITQFGGAARHSIVALDGNTEAARLIGPGGGAAACLTPPRHRGLLPSLASAIGVLRQLRPDTVMTQNWGAIEWAMAARLLGLRHVHAEDGFGPEEAHGQLPRRVWTRRLVLRGSQVILPSRVLLRLAREVWHLPEQTLHLIPNGVDLAAPGRERPLDLPAAFAGRPVIGTIAALRPEKALDRLIGAYAHLRAAGGPEPAPVLVIAGDGPERARLAALAAASPWAADIHFTGHVSPAARAHLCFDLLALSSDTEQMPLSVLEAMAAGRPVVSTDVGDVVAMVAAENAPFIVPRDAAALAGAMAALLGDRPRAAAIGAANRQRAEAQYGEPAMVRAWAEVLAVTLPPSLPGRSP